MTAAPGQPIPNEPEEPVPDHARPTSRPVREPRQPRYDEAAERAICATLVMDPARWPDVENVVACDDFYVPRYRETFAAICELVAEGTAPKAPELIDRLRSHGMLEMAGGRHEVALLALGPEVGERHAVGDHAALVARYAASRRWGHLGAELLEAAYDVDEERALRALEAARAVVKPAGRLEIVTRAQLASRVEERGETQWLAQPIWPEGDYGVIAAEQKLGKSWLTMDLAVSASTGTKWLGHFPTMQGPVLSFLGEGGERKMERRLQAVEAHRGTRAEDLHLCFRAPHLTDTRAMAEVRAAIRRIGPTLVVIDPLYLAARGAKTSLLNEMGEHLEEAQHLCQEAGCALVIVHHWNKTGTGQGAERMSGAGPAEWGRVLGSMSGKVAADPLTKATTAWLSLSFQGDEIPETKLRLRRRIWADDPSSLDSPLHYEVRVEEQRMDDEGHGWRPTGVMEKISRWLELQAEGASAREVRDTVKGKSEYKDLALRILVDEGYVEAQRKGRSLRHMSVKQYRAPDAEPLPASPQEPSFESDWPDEGEEPAELF